MENIKFIIDKIINFYVLTFRFVERQKEERLCALSSKKHFLKVICSLIFGHVTLIYCYSNEHRGQLIRLQHG